MHMLCLVLPVKAEERNLDLVKISPNAKPPVCKIMDYGKYRFEQSKLVLGELPPQT